MVIRQKASINEGRCAVRGAIESKSENREGANKYKSFVVFRLRHGNEILKIQNVQFQLRYRSPTTIHSYGKLLLLHLLCHF